MNQGKKNQISLLDESLRQLAMVKPAVAMDAAVALLDHPSAAMRAQAIELGALVSSSQGPRVSKSKALIEFLTKMLSGDEIGSIEFAKQAEHAVRKRAADLLTRLDVERLLKIEDALPGFACSPSSDALAKAPSLAARLKIAGKIDAQKSAVVHWNMACDANRAQTQSESLAKTESKNPLPKDAFDKMEKECLAQFFDAKNRMASASAADPNWQSDYWRHYWGLNLRRIGEREGVVGLYGSQALVGLEKGVDFMAHFPMVESALHTARGAQFSKMLDDLGSLGNNEACMAFGRWLAKAGVDFLDANVTLGMGESRFPHWVENGFSIYDLMPANDSAKLMSSIKPYQGWGGPLTEARRAQRWLMVAEGLRQAGAAPPKYFMIKSRRPEIAQKLNMKKLGAVILPVVMRSPDQDIKTLEWMCSGDSDESFDLVASCVKEVREKNMTRATQDHALFESCFARLEAMSLRVDCSEASSPKAIGPRL